MGNGSPGTSARGHVFPDQPIAFLLYSGFGLDPVDGASRQPGCGYHVVLNGFRSVLVELGSTIMLNRLADLDATLDEQERRGARCVLLCFMPPHQAPVGLRCPTVCIFSWEFADDPDGMVGQDRRADWRTVLACHGRAISLSTHSAHLVHEAMGTDFPVTVVAVPLPERLSRLAQRGGAAWSGTIAIRGSVYDSRAYGPCFERPAPAAPVEPTSRRNAPAPASSLRVSIGVSRYYALMWYRDAVRTLLPRSVTGMISRIGRFHNRVRLVLRRSASRRLLARPVEPVQRVMVDGVVYAAVFDPTDNRTNWHDMLTAFCWAFRDISDVTLVMRMVHQDRFAFTETLAGLIRKLQPFRCRVVTLQGVLDDDEYDALISASDYYVNTSSCEAVCLPLMEFMGAGRPAIAPDHTALADYIDASNAFVLRSGLDYNFWPQDLRHLFRGMRRRLDWDSLLDAYRTSYQVRIDDPARYTAMGQAARQATRRTCSRPVVKAKLEQAIGQALGQLA